METEIIEEGVDAAEAERNPEERPTGLPEPARTQFTPASR